jgi:hypothetical protein
VAGFLGSGSGAAGESGSFAQAVSDGRDWIRAEKGGSGAKKWAKIFEFSERCCACVVSGPFLRPLSSAEKRTVLSTGRFGLDRRRFAVGFESKWGATGGTLPYFRPDWQEMQPEVEFFIQSDDAASITKTLM